MIARSICCNDFSISVIVSLWSCSEAISMAMLIWRWWVVDRPVGISDCLCSAERISVAIAAAILSARVCRSITRLISFCVGSAGALRQYQISNSTTTTAVAAYLEYVHMWDDAFCSVVVSIVLQSVCLPPAYIYSAISSCGRRFWMCSMYPMRVDQDPPGVSDASGKLNMRVVGMHEVSKGYRGR
jgi:hypothetical protein